MMLFVGSEPYTELENNSNVGFKIIDAININLNFQNKNQNLKDY